VTARCFVCLGDVPADSDSGDTPYHPRCASRLFGAPRAPAIDLDLARLHTVALAMVGHTSLSGVQRKVSVGLTADRATLRVVTDHGHFILKPQAQTFPHLPENEHVTMRIAEAAGLDVPANGLVRLRDGTLAYVTRRFDRTEDGAKRLQEDFCQLAGLSPKQKYEGSAELCSRLVRRHASEPLVTALALFRQLAFGWWTGNGDLHLKNLSLLRGEDGRHRLSPAYDLLCTELVVPDDQLALPVGGNRRSVTPRQWVAFAAYCGLPPRAAARALADLHAALPRALDLVGRSLLPEEPRARYAALLTARARTLEKGAALARGA
jgi:serine/threonine-protein kinase HipA